MKTIKIEIPNGFEVESFDKSSCEIKFKPTPKPVTERIKNFEDVLSDLGIDLEDFEEDCEDLTSDEVAYRQLKFITKVFNDGWEPDWTNSSEYKYYPWFKMDGSSGSGFAYLDCAYWLANSNFGSRLCFKSRKLAEYAGTQFEDIYKEFLTLK